MQLWGLLLLLPWAYAAAAVPRPQPRTAQLLLLLLLAPWLWLLHLWAISLQLCNGFIQSDIQRRQLQKLLCTPSRICSATRSTAGSCGCCDCCGRHYCHCDWKGPAAVGVAVAALDFEGAFPCRVTGCCCCCC